MLAVVLTVLSAAIGVLIKTGVVESYATSIKSLFKPKKHEVAPELVKSFEEQLAEELSSVLPGSTIKRIDAYTISVESTPNLLVLFNSNKDLKLQVRSLQTIITQSRIEKRQLRKIDLRFDKIALQYLD